MSIVFQSHSQYFLGMCNASGTVRKVIKLSKGHDIHGRHCEASHGGSSVVGSEAEQSLNPHSTNYYSQDPRLDYLLDYSKL